MIAMRLSLFALISGVVLAFPAAAAEAPNLERGRSLYENHCIVCHTPKVHRRVPSLPLRVEDLRTIVSMWATHQGLRWSQQEIEDVVYYLDRVHYRFER